jgi:hypothetical protein
LGRLAPYIIRSSLSWPQSIDIIGIRGWGNLSAFSFLVVEVPGYRLYLLGYDCLSDGSRLFGLVDDSRSGCERSRAQFPEQPSLFPWTWLCIRMGLRMWWRKVGYLENSRTTPVGFEPTRGDPIGSAGRRLNRSAKVSLKRMEPCYYMGDPITCARVCTRVILTIQVARVGSSRKSLQQALGCLVRWHDSRFGCERPTYNLSRCALYIHTKAQCLSSSDTHTYITSM